jgi:hypothetical protein
MLFNWHHLQHLATQNLGFGMHFQFLLSKQGKAKSSVAQDDRCMVCTKRGLCSLWSLVVEYDS